MPDAYPLFLDLERRPCLVVGGGSVAARKVKGLLAAGARVTVVSPHLAEPLREWVESGAVTWMDRPFKPSDLDAAVLVFATTPSRAVNVEVAREARARGVWANVADDPDGCDFHVPAVARRGGVGVAVSTAGASPALAAWVRDGIAEGLPAGLEALAALSSRLRDQTRGDPNAGRRFREFFASGVHEDLAREDWEQAAEKVARAFGREMTVREVREALEPS